MTTNATTHLREALADAGIDLAGAEAWLTLAHSDTPERITRTATDWAGEGIPGPDAVRWHMAGWKPSTSVIWWMLGFTPAQATFVSNRLKVLGLDAAQMKDWLYSPLIPDDIVLCLAAGVSNVDAALEIYSRFGQDTSLRGTLTVHAALNGVNVHDLKAS